MNQTVQQLQNNQRPLSLSSEQLQLIKYCWSNTVSMQEETKQLIASCADAVLTKQLHSIFETYIMPYYYENRTVFNRIREHFVQFMHLCLTNQNVHGLSPYSFLLRYHHICVATRAIYEPGSEQISMELIQKAQSEVTRLT